MILRTVTMDDLEVVSRNWRLDECVVSREEAVEAITRMRDRHAQNASGKVLHLCLAIFAKDSGDFVGWCGLDHSNRDWPHPVLFYALKTCYWGKGLATEAAMAVLEYAFGVLELDEVDAGAAADNPASVRVLHKLGMRYAGRDDQGGHAFALTRQEHQAQNSARGTTCRC